MRRDRVTRYEDACRRWPSERVDRSGRSWVERAGRLVASKLLTTRGGSNDVAEPQKPIRREASFAVMGLLFILSVRERVASSPRRGRAPVAVLLAIISIGQVSARAPMDEDAVSLGQLVRQATALDIRIENHDPDLTDDSIVLRHMPASRDGLIDALEAALPRTIVMEAEGEASVHILPEGFEDELVAQASERAAGLDADARLSGLAGASVLPDPDMSRLRILDDLRERGREERDLVLLYRRVVGPGQVSDVYDFEVSWLPEMDGLFPRRRDGRTPEENRLEAFVSFHGARGWIAQHEDRLEVLRNDAGDWFFRLEDDPGALLMLSNTGTFEMVMRTPGVPDFLPEFSAFARGEPGDMEVRLDFALPSGELTMVDRVSVAP